MISGREEYKWNTVASPKSGETIRTAGIGGPKLHAVSCAEMSNMVDCRSRASAPEIRISFQERYDSRAIPAEDIAGTIAFSVSDPDFDGINEIIVRPTKQVV